MSRDVPAPAFMSDIIIHHSYIEMASGMIVRSLITHHLEREGIKAGRIDDGCVLSFHAKYRTPKDILDQLADLNAFIWWVDPLNRLNFLADVSVTEGLLEARERMMELYRKTQHTTYSED